MVHFLTPVLLDTSAPTQTGSAKFWSYGMGLETLERSGAMVSHAQKSSHFLQEVVLAQ